jgi:hypothetical protein
MLDHAQRVPEALIVRTCGAVAVDTAGAVAVDIALGALARATPV